METISIHKLWSTQLQDSVNCLAVGKPFMEDFSEENDVLIGTTAGRVLILNQTKVNNNKKKGRNIFMTHSAMVSQ